MLLDVFLLCADVLFLMCPVSISAAFLMMSVIAFRALLIEPVSFGMSCIILSSTGSSPGFLMYSMNCAMTPTHKR